MRKERKRKSGAAVIWSQPRADFHRNRHHRWEAAVDGVDDCYIVGWTFKNIKFYDSQMYVWGCVRERRAVWKSRARNLYRKKSSNRLCVYSYRRNMNCIYRIRYILAKDYYLYVYTENINIKNFKLYNYVLTCFFRCFESSDHSVNVKSMPK